MGDLDPKAQAHLGPIPWPTLYNVKPGILLEP